MASARRPRSKSDAECWAAVEVCCHLCSARRLEHPWPVRRLLTLIQPTTGPVYFGKYASVSPVASVGSAMTSRGLTAGAQTDRRGRITHIRTVNRGRAGKPTAGRARRRPPRISAKSGGRQPQKSYRNSEYRIRQLAACSTSDAGVGQFAPSVGKGRTHFFSSSSSKSAFRLFWASAKSGSTSSASR